MSNTDFSISPLYSSHFEISIISVFIGIIAIRGIIVAGNPAKAVSTLVWGIICLIAFYSTVSPYFINLVRQQVLSEKSAEKFLPYLIPYPVIFILLILCIVAAIINLATRGTARRQVYVRRGSAARRYNSSGKTYSDYSSGYSPSNKYEDEAERQRAQYQRYLYDLKVYQAEEERRQQQQYEQQVWENYGYQEELTYGYNSYSGYVNSNYDDSYSSYSYTDYSSYSSYSSYSDYSSYSSYSYSDYSYS